MGFFDSFATGFLKGEISKVEAANEKQRLADLRNAELNDSITLMEKEAETNARILADKEEAAAIKQKEKMNKVLLGMGFNQQYIDQEAQYALLGPDYLSDWYKQRAELYQSPVWHKSKINFPNDPKNKGKFVWEAELLKSVSNSNTGGSGFDSNQVASTVGQEANISDNVVNSQLSTNVNNKTSTDPLQLAASQNMFSNSNDFTNYLPHETIYGKASTDVAGEGKQFISLDGNLAVTAYQKMSNFIDDTGKSTKKSDGIYYVATNYGPVPVADFYANFGLDYVGEESENFKDLQRLLMFDGVASTYPVEYMVTDPSRKKTYTVNGIGTSYSDPSRPDTFEIDRMNNELALVTNIDLATYSTVQEGVPGRGEETVFNAYSIPFPEFTELLSNMNYNIAQIYNGKGSSSGSGISTGDISATQERLGVRQPIDISTSQRGTAISTLTSVSNYLTNEDIRVRQVGDNTIYEIPKMEPNSIKGAFFASFNELLGSYSQNNLSEGLLKELYGDRYSPNMTPDLNDLVSVFATYHNDLYDRAVAYHTEEITDMSSDDFKTKYGNKKDDTSIFEQAQVLANNDLRKLRTSLDIVNQSNIYKTNIQRSAEAESRQVEERINSIFRGNTLGGFEAVKSVIGELVSDYVNDPTNQDQIDDLKAELINTLGADRDNVAGDVDYVMKNYVIPQLFPDMAASDLSNVGSVSTKGEVKAAEESIAVNEWLEKDAITDTESSRIRAGAGGQRETFVVPLDDSASGSLAAGRLYDTDTGYLLFKSPTLPAGHVEPIPNIGDKFFGNKTRKNWISLWDKTHDRVTGKPKEQ